MLAAAAAAAPLASAQAERGTVRLDGRPVLRVEATDDATAAERARRVERRLHALLETGRALPRAAVASAEDGHVVTIAGRAVLTVRARDAAQLGTAPEALAREWAAALDVALDRAVRQRQSRWSRFVAEVRGSVRGAFSQLAESAIRVVPRVLAALLVVVLFWLLAAGVRFLMRALFHRIVDDLTVENLVKQVAYYSIWVLGLIVAVHALGFEPQTVVAGLGLTGLALGFALKDILSNFVSGLLLLTLRPFRIGDQIVVGDTEGAVERIRLRATDIRTYDGRLVLVPSAEILTSRVTNNTASPVRRASVELNLSYATDLPKALEVLRAATARIDGVLAQPPVVVRVAALEAQDLALEVRFWTDSRRSDFVATQAAVRRSVIEALGKEGIPLPDPDVRALVPRDAERWRAIFEPPTR